MPVVSGALTGQIGTDVPKHTFGKVENAVCTLANTEYSHTFPTDTKTFLVQARQNGTIKLTFDAGTSGTVYHSIWPGCFYSIGFIVAASTTIYFQSPTAGLVLELTSWS